MKKRSRPSCGPLSGNRRLDLRASPNQACCPHAEAAHNGAGRGAPHCPGRGGVGGTAHEGAGVSGKAVESVDGMLFTERNGQSTVRRSATSTGSLGAGGNQCHSSSPQNAPGRGISWQPYYVSALTTARPQNQVFPTERPKLVSFDWVLILSGKRIECGSRTDEDVGRESLGDLPGKRGTRTGLHWSSSKECHSRVAEVGHQHEQCRVQRIYRCAWGRSTRAGVDRSSVGQRAAQARHHRSGHGLDDSEELWASRSVGGAEFERIRPRGDQTGAQPQRRHGL